MALIPFVLTAVLIREIAGHGMMLEPPSRSSLWRFDEAGVKNYDDNSLFCGGAAVQNEQNGGRCGLCGDDWAAPHPQDNENTGKYGQGVVGGVYQAGSVIDVHVQLTSNHMGTFNYSLCVLEDPTKPEPEDCFETLTLEDGTINFEVSSSISDYINKVQLPNITCERCVFRWTYKAGNSWGVCGNGEGRLGCGPQEHFRNCADISIVA